MMFILKLRKDETQYLESNLSRLSSQHLSCFPCRQTSHRAGSVSRTSLYSPRASQSHLGISCHSSSQVFRFSRSQHAFYFSFSTCFPFEGLLCDSLIVSSDHVAQYGHFFLDHCRGCSLHAHFSFYLCFSLEFILLYYRAFFFNISE